MSDHEQQMPNDQPVVLPTAPEAPAPPSPPVVNQGTPAPSMTAANWPTQRIVAIGGAALYHRWFPDALGNDQHRIRFDKPQWHRRRWSHHARRRHHYRHSRTHEKVFGISDYLSNHRSRACLRLLQRFQQHRHRQRLRIGICRMGSHCCNALWYRRSRRLSADDANTASREAARRISGHDQLAKRSRIKASSVNVGAAGVCRCCSGSSVSPTRAFWRTRDVGGA